MARRVPCDLPSRACAVRPSTRRGSGLLCQADRPPGGCERVLQGSRGSVGSGALCWKGEDRCSDRGP